MASRSRERISRAARAAGALLVLLLPAGCAGLAGERPALEVALVSLAPRDISPLEQTIDLSLRVRNPSNASLTLTGLKFDLALNGRPLLRGLSNARAEVPRLGSALVRAEGSTTTLGLLQHLLALGAGRPFTYRMSGVAYADGAWGGSIPFESAGEIDLRGPGGGPRR